MFDFLRNLTKSAEEKRQEAITAYLDDTLSPNERERFAAQLAQDPQLQAEVAQERAVKQSLSQLPQRRVPRNFTLNPALYGRPAKQPLIQAYPVLRAATGLAAVFFIFALVTGLYLGGSPAPQAAESAGGMIAMDTAVEQEAETAAEEQIEEEAMEEPALFAEMTEEPAEEMMAEEEAVEEAAPAAAPSEGDGMMTNGEAPTGAEDAESSPSPTLTIAATPTAAPTATTSQLPRATATAEFTDRAITTTTDTGDTLETDAGEIALAATALPLDEFAAGTAVPEQREQPATQPVNTLLLIQISLLILLIILGALTLYTRQQL